MSSSAAIPPDGDDQHYDRTTVVLHWATAAVVLLLWIVGQTIDDFPKGLPRIGARTAHILFGAALAILLIGRIIWRLHGGRRLTPASPGMVGRVERSYHWLLYALLLATVSLGVANAWIRGDTLLGLFKIPSIAPGNKELKELVEDLHAYAANTVVIAAGLHALAALVHHFYLKDGVLRRMLRRPSPVAAPR
jgi:cytochrome b561